MVVAADELGSTICNLTLQRRRRENRIGRVQFFYRDPHIHYELLSRIWSKQLGQIFQCHRTTNGIEVLTIYLLAIDCDSDENTYPAGGHLDIGDV